MGRMSRSVLQTFCRRSSAGLVVRVVAALLVISSVYGGVGRRVSNMINGIGNPVWIADVYF